LKKAFTLIELLIVVAIIAILAAIAVPNFLEAQTRAKVARVVSDMRTYSTALGTYQIDSSTYFPYYSSPSKAPAPTGVTDNINSILATQAGHAEAANLKKLPSFAFKNGAGATPPLSLTTPVSYLNTYVPDTFAQFKQATFGYVSGPAYLIWSSGPDQVDQLNNGNAAEVMANAGQSLPSQYLIVGPGNGTTAPTAPTPFGAAPGTGLAFTYDSSNGTASAGDVYRTP
jgi:prepilin-type N-terminal cleavage/methylation domain-containing protein